MNKPRLVAMSVASALALACLASAQPQPPAPSKDQAHAEKLKLQKFAKDYSHTKAVMKKKNDQASKVAFANVATGYGTLVMNSLTITDRHKKYVFALHMFREALVADPTNKEAQQNKDLIESIYKSMGKPIPK